MVIGSSYRCKTAPPRREPSIAFHVSYLLQALSVPDEDT
jgi:hypothetical protein